MKHPANCSIFSAVALPAARRTAVAVLTTALPLVPGAPAARAEPATWLGGALRLLGGATVGWKRRRTAGMTSPFAKRRVIVAGLVAISVVGAVATQAQTSQIVTLANFTSSTGIEPVGDVALVNNTLYGSTTLGGSGNSGTVFSVPTTGGVPVVLASFNGVNGGPDAEGGVTVVNNTIYGTTQQGGTNGSGVVYSVPLGGGAPTTIANFNVANGSAPVAGLTLISGRLYGTTTGQGQGENPGTNGTVFSAPLTASGGGGVTTLATFGGSNGSVPAGRVMFSGGNLYGTTLTGGANDQGTVFSLPLGGGTPTLLASFNGTNGANPHGSLLQVGNTLYGTTTGGGSNTDGTVFSVPVGGGAVTLLGSFNRSTTGEAPEGGLTLVGSRLYGTTSEGGTNNDGTIFSVSLGGGDLSTVATFNGTNGASSFSTLTLSADGTTLYGATEEGGSANFGTVFAVTVPSDVPEPGTWIGGLGIAGVAALTLRRRLRGC